MNLFREWLAQCDADAEAEQEAIETDELNDAAYKHKRMLDMISAVTAFFPDIPVLESYVRWGATSY